jgi:YidC/Oxa1 family membrane protein insertase
VFSSLGSIGSSVMQPLYWVTSILLSGFHHVFGGLLGPDSGWAWAFSIIALTVLIRAALIPLFVKQIKSSRNMQLLQPKVKELQKKYSHDRERLAQETMALYKETGTNPFASCLPILLQMPIFLALFRLIDNASKGNVRGVLTAGQVTSLQHAKLFGAEIASSFTHAGGSLDVKVLAAVLVVAMTATTFTTQRQLMSKNMPADAMSGPYAQQQKMLLYVLPLVFAVGGVAFPIGVLLYWTTSNLWTMCQQFYVIRNNPAPGTPAARAKEERDAHKAARGHHAQPEATLEQEQPRQVEPPRRAQPKKQSRSERRTQKPRVIPPSGAGGSHPAPPGESSPAAPEKPGA